MGELAIKIACSKGDMGMLFDIISHMDPESAVRRENNHTIDLPDDTEDL